MEEEKKEVAEITASTMMPTTFNNRYTMSKILASSGLMPNGMDTAEKVCVALQYGYELGLSPMVSVNNIAVVNGKPTLGTDIMHAIVRHSKEYGGVEWVCQDNKKAECIVHRINANYREDVRGLYTIEMATAAGLTKKDNWAKYPARMLKHRALSYALRDAFPDVLAGIYSPDEMDMETAPEIRDITPPEEQQKPAEAVAPKTNQTSAVVPDEIF